MNDFRSRVLSGQEPKPSRLLAGKVKRNRAEGDSLENVTMPRSESRTANHREADRHRLADGSITAIHSGERHKVRLINLSGGGAMVEGQWRPEMWDRVDLELAEGQSIECAVRWLKGKRVGLEFAHETHISAEEDVSRNLLREVLQRNFADLESPVEALQAEPPEALEPEQQDESEAHVLADHSRRAELRHPLIWTGQVHFDHDSRPVRLRDISATGAMIESAETYPIDAEIYLDLDEAGSLFGRVRWTRGDQAGLQFSSRFDLMKLAKQRPQLTPGRWTKPDYLKDGSPETSPWASEWGRLTIPELHRTLKR